MVRVVKSRILRCVGHAARMEEGRVAFVNLSGNRPLGRLLNEQLRSIYCSSSIMRMIKSRILRWVGYAARMEEGRRTILE